MDNRPIGVFDSGLGGLTAVKALRRLLPGEDLIYFGDTARVPYGGRSRETLLKYARQDIAFLRSFDLKAVLIACGTVTSLLWIPCGRKMICLCWAWWSPLAGRHWLSQKIKRSA